MLLWIFENGITTNKFTKRLIILEYDRMLWWIYKI